ncbi:hypothetical protein HNV12_11650 [Methanococcoides sp. SA1]|nr:hypothetical protein [Methanococcoides sp. SA1]
MDSEQANLFSARFNRRFLDRHAGKMITDPKIAIVELVANCWDAGATEVRIKWPIPPNNYFEILDNGSGMSKDEFISRWRELNYDRIQKQGEYTILPKSGKKRKVYGKNGKGRHSLFCFSNNYSVESWKDGTCSLFKVKRSSGNSPFDIESIKNTSKKEHGTKLYCNFQHRWIEEIPFNYNEIEDLLATKFVADPSDFRIYVNNSKIETGDILKNAKEYSIDIDDHKSLKLFVIESMTSGRTTKQHGVAWWVNGRLVGEQSWKDFEGTLLDGRTSTAKRYSVIVKADILSNNVLEDWTGFQDNETVKKVKRTIREALLNIIQVLASDLRKEEKINLLKKQKPKLKKMTTSSQQSVGHFITEVQKRCPTIKYQDLENVVDILSTMEESKSTYKLLKQLTYLSPDDVDSLSFILDEWSVMDAKLVLDELKRRLDLIYELDRLIDDPNTDELHQLQPLFEHGLWIFGPEYESIEFLSNRTLNTIVRTHFEKKNTALLDNGRKRPDFVAFLDGNLGCYHRDSYDKDGKVCGIAKVLIIELKRGGYKVTDDDLNQAEGYAKSLIKAGQLTKDTKIECFVLGTSVDNLCETRESGKTITINPRTYHVVINQAQSRTFNLKRKIEKYSGVVSEVDLEVKKVLDQNDLYDLINTH